MDDSELLKLIQTHYEHMQLDRAVEMVAAYRQRQPDQQLPLFTEIE